MRRLILLAIVLAGFAAAQEITPAQQQGPFYPPEKPSDRDSDLTSVPGAVDLPRGDLLLLDGRVLDSEGQPVVGAVVEIWQTDAGGAYLHPNDPASAGRDMNFQFYGESVTSESGAYAFRTIVPGQYEPRPRHIHFKIRLDGEELLTSQLYFAGLPNEDSGRVPAALVVTLVPISDDAYPVAWAGSKDIVLALKR